MFLLPAQITPFREADMHGPNVESMRRFNYYHPTNCGLWWRTGLDASKAGGAS